MDTENIMKISPVRKESKKRSRQDEDEPLSPRSASLRPPKRPALGLDVPLIGHAPQTLFRDVEEPPNVPRISSWRYSDDWVNRTGGLRLDSPLPSIPNAGLLLLNEADFASLRGAPPHQMPTQNTYLPTPTDSPLATVQSFEGYTSINQGSEMPLNVSYPRNDVPQEEDVMMMSPQAEQTRVEKKKLVLGYREGCESCRRRVPGHYMHIIAD
ncbi:SubName: Full=Uncharacterized protein {ECO:0000313/EMBL:CCA66861.1} [Serendipita indica DSM 11827]|nr:SubName: Full=Uncharacterized protein {ECO:0000313/EMBL:CCA66861.1} [Serendipita indica DSM 11827]